jgi:hypothetical protein
MDIIATHSMICHSHKQQIPPLRCAPIGMTNYFNKFPNYFNNSKGRTLAFNQDGESQEMLCQ